MLEMDKSERAFFRKGEQKNFLTRVNKKLSISELAKICQCSERTIRDWRHEKFSMSLLCLERLCKKTGQIIPSFVKIRPRYWHTREAGVAGGKAVVQKYKKVGGDPEHRKRQWRKWWDKEGKNKTSLPIKPIPIQKPKKSKKLAEFIGIILGDGGISQRQLTVTLHSVDDKEYGVFVKNLIEQLFAVPVSVRSRKDGAVTNYVVSRTALVRFCIEVLGLKSGDKVKNQIDVPDWIKQSKSYSIACLRGLVDTDGSIFTHKYNVRGKSYRYKKIGFTSRSKPLLRFVFTTLTKLGLNPRYAGRSDVRLESVDDVKNYIDLVGVHNPKHLRRYEN